MPGQDWVKKKQLPVHIQYVSRLLTYGQK